MFLIEDLKRVICLSKAGKYIFSIGDSKGTFYFLKTPKGEVRKTFYKKAPKGLQRVSFYRITRKVFFLSTTPNRIIIQKNSKRVIFLEDSKRSYICRRTQNGLLLQEDPKLIEGSKEYPFLKRLQRVIFIEYPKGSSFYQWPKRYFFYRKPQRNACFVKDPI